MKPVRRSRFARNPARSARSDWWVCLPSLVMAILLALLIAAVLVGCAAPAEEETPAPAAPPVATAPCPGPLRVPKAPRGVRSPESLAAYAIELDAALAASERARAECSRRAAQMEAWIGTSPPPPTP